MVDSSEGGSESSADSDMDSSKSGSSSDIDTVKQHTPRQENEKPSSALDTPKALRRTEDRQRGG